MRFKSSLLALSLFSLVCFSPRVTLADTLTLTNTTGGSTDGINIYPYEFTVTGPGGTNLNVTMSCLNFNREISFGETWAVDPMAVSTINPSGTYDHESGASILEDAWLYNQYGTAAGASSEIQFAIWSIMDPTDINASNNSYDGANAFDSTAQALAALAIANVTEPNPLPASYFANDIVFLPDPGGSSNWTNGEPQIFMVDPPPPAIAPEPGSLALLGTGLLGTALAMRRNRLVPARNS
jgi:hypothetical protein